MVESSSFLPCFGRNLREKSKGSGLFLLGRPQRVTQWFHGDAPGVQKSGLGADARFDTNEHVAEALVGRRWELIFDN
jgi:hypothetical protein